MTITREEIISQVAAKCNFYKKHVQMVFDTLDEIVIDAFDNVTEDEDVTINLVNGIKLWGRCIPERDRVDPRDGSPIVCRPTVKVLCKQSPSFKAKLQEQLISKS